MAKFIITMRALNTEPHNYMGKIVRAIQKSLKYSGRIFSVKPLMKTNMQTLKLSTLSDI